MTRATGLLSKLRSGFQLLSLDQAPRLRQLREQSEAEDIFEEAWKDVAEALNEAMQAMSRFVPDR